MVCKNCGADLKPNIKYCLECGSYIDDEDYEDEFDDEIGELSTDHRPVALRDESKKKRRKKLNLTVTDYLIYGGLLTVMIVSIIVIIVSLVSSNKPVEPDYPIVEEAQDAVLTIDNYEVTVPANLTSTTQGSYLYVSDNQNYTFSFQNTQDDFDSYVDDPTHLETNLTNSHYEVISSSNKTVNSRMFLVYEIKVNGVPKVLYLTRVNSRYTGMGIIEILNNGNWEDALPVIDTVVNSINFH